MPLMRDLCLNGLRLCLSGEPETMGGEPQSYDLDHLATFTVSQNKGRFNGDPCLGPKTKVGQMVTLVLGQNKGRANGDPCLGPKQR